ncbi:MAG: hypothetical protein HFH72_09010 [Lachnospiraceae bacterium]|nr:hypothetical protein [Lachnospiraceae bacterium]
MIDLTDEQKRLFYTGGNWKDYIFYFPEIDFKITNDTIHQEEVTIKEAVCEDEDFTLGGCIASSIEFDVSEIIEQDLTGLEFFATLYVNLKEDGTYSLKLPMGKYRVESAKMVDDKDYKRIVAYDSLYDASIDISGWYNSYFSTGMHTIKETMTDFLQYIKIPFKEKNIPNESILLKKQKDYAKGEITGTELLRSICTILGTFGKVNREGYFELIFPSSPALFPEETLYPSNDLFPEDTFAYLGVSDGNDEVAEYVNTTYEEYVTSRITCLFIQTETETVKIGEDESNPYIISGNFLLYGKTTAELQEIGRNIFERIKDITYRPNTTTLYGLPYVESGDAFGLIKRRDTIESFAFSRTMSGIQYLKDTYEAKGGKLRANELSIIDKIDNIEEKTEYIEDNVEELEESVDELDRKSGARFEVLEDSIEAEVTRATEEEGELSSRITITAEGLSSEVERAINKENMLSTVITQTADEIKLEASQIYETKEHGMESYAELHSQISLSAEKIESTVSATYETKKDAYDSYVELNSSITQTAGEISQKVSRGEVVSEINQSPEQITLLANRLIVQSSNFSLDGSGNATFSGNLSGASGSFSGEITANSGKIGNFDIIGGGLYSYATQVLENYVTSTNISSTNGMDAYTMTCTGPLYAQGAANTTTTNKTNMVVINTSTGELKLSESSSKRYKHDITPLITEELNPERLYDIPINEYVYNADYLDVDDPRYNKKVIGIIAEEVEKHYPIAAEKNEYGETENWNDRYLIPPMLSLIQKQHKEIEKLKSDIAGLSCEFFMLKQRMEDFLC